MSCVDDENLAFVSVAEQGRMIRDRRISPLELVDVYLDRIDRYDDIVRSYITVGRDDARAAARVAGEEIAHGRYRGPLHGIVFGVKDQLWSKGMPTTLAWAGMRENRTEKDAAVVESLQRAGAILLGKHNLDQFGKGGTVNWDFGRTRNPWNPDFSPAGSSGGSGAATAAGFCAAALGEDTGGSVRLPASANGLVGLRPTFGRVSRFGGYLYGWTADTIGPLARTAEDAALLLKEIAGHDPRDPLTSRLPVPDYQAQLQAGVEGLRIGIVTNLIDADGVEPDVRAAFEASITVLAGLGAEIHATDLPLAHYSVPLLMLTSDADVASAIGRKWLKQRYNEVDAGIRTRLAAAYLVPSSAYSTAMRCRAVVRAEIFDRLKQFDILACPTVPNAPKRISGEPSQRQSDSDNPGPDFQQDVVLERMFTYPFSLANTPAISVQNGVDGNGLPTGLQLVGRPFAEADLLRATAAYQSATEWHTKHPELDKTLSGFANGSPLNSDR